VAAGVWRGTVSRITGGQVWLTVPRLIARGEVGPVISAVDPANLEAGVRVIVGLVEGRPDDLAILGRADGQGGLPPGFLDWLTATLDDLAAAAAALEAADTALAAADAALDARLDALESAPAVEVDESLIWLVVNP